jgi:predicted DNA-binding transcriptional regulator AlpA
MSPTDRTSRVKSIHDDQQLRDDDEFLTDGQLCEMLHVTSRTTMRWRRDGNGPVFIRCGERRVLYRRADVLAWLTARTYPHAPRKQLPPEKTPTRGDVRGRIG